MIPLIWIIRNILYRWMTGNNTSDSMVSQFRLFPKAVFIKPNLSMNSIGKLSEVGNVEIATAILTDTPIEFEISDEEYLRVRDSFRILSNACTHGWVCEERHYPFEPMHLW